MGYGEIGNGDSGIIDEDNLQFQEKLLKNSPRMIIYEE